MQSDGHILAGGNFTSIGGEVRRNIARLDAVSGLVDSFNPDANSYVQSIAVQADGKILAGGDFTSIGGEARNYIARLDAVTGLADSFNPNANRRVSTIAVLADGKILVGGDFSGVGGLFREGLARLSNDSSAMQDLAVTPASVVWTRGGSSPQFARVVFEGSADGVNYSFLGNGTAAGTDWALTGLNLSIGQNLYIRPRGYYSSSEGNGCRSIQESVWNVFLTNTDTDTDADGVIDSADNCTLTANPTQLDADAAGYGNICDADINNSGTVTTADFGLLRSVLGQPISFSPTAAAADMNGSGTVTTADFGLLRARLGTPPGPSGLACAGTVPCP